MRFFFLFFMIGAFPLMAESVVPETRTDLMVTFSPVVKKVAPAVVNVYATHAVKSFASSPFFDDPLFKQFFGESGPSVERRPSQVQSSLGSGVIVRAEGIVITNYHVVKTAQAIKIVLFDGREFDGAIILKDKRTDIAIIRLDTKGEKLPFLEFRDADQLEVGDVVLAFGNPFGFGHTVTSGIISGLARSQLGASDFRSLIQTDAAVNPGNSGGPLVTLDGKIVGINTAIFSNTGGSIGISFAVPSNLVLPVLASLDHGGEVIRPWIGAKVRTVTFQIAKELGFEKPHGVVIKKVFKNSPAEKASLKEGDVVFEVDGHKIHDEGAFRFRLATLQVGKAVDFQIWRAGVLQSVKVTVQKPPEFPNNEKTVLTGRHPLSGAVVVGLSPAVANQFGLDFDVEGVVILGLKPGAPATMTGVLSGDVVLSVNGAETLRVPDLISNLSRGRMGWEITLMRGGKEQKLIVRNW